MKKKSFAIILTSVILAAVVLAGAFVALVSAKMSKDIQEQYHQKYEVYDFSEEHILIQYFENAYSYSDYDYYSEYDKPNSNYQKSYDSEDELSYVITVTADGTLTKEAVVFDEDTEKFGDAPVFTKNLTKEQVEDLKNEIIKSDIKVILHEAEKSYNYYTFNDTETNEYKSMKIYADSEIYTVSHKKIEKNTSLNTLYEYILGLLSDEDNKEFEEMVNDYYGGFEYDFEDTGNQPFIMYSERIFYTEDDSLQSFMVSVELDTDGKVEVTGEYTEGDQKFADKLNEYYSNAKSEVSEEEVKEIMQAVVESNFIKYAEAADEGYEATADDVDDGSYSVYQYITVRFNGEAYYIANGTNPDFEFLKLKNKFFDIVLNSNQNAVSQ